MREHRSQLREKYGHADIVFWVDEHVGSGVDWLLSYFQGEVQRGRVFRAGDTVQIGWMVVMLKSDAQGNLELWEPDFDSTPIRWVRTVNNTFRHLLLQRSVCDVLALAPTFPCLRQAGLVFPSFFSPGAAFFMSRGEASGNISGWEFRGPAREQSSGGLVSLYEISLNRSAAIPFLSLPTGATVHHTGAQIEVSLGKIKRSSTSDPFLGELAQMSVFV